MERRPRRVENHRKGDLAAETGSCPDGDVRLLPLRRERGQGLGRGLSILVFVLGARGLWGSEPDGVGDDGRDGGKRADGERRRGSVEEDVVLHLSFTFSSSLSLVELEKTSPPWTSTGAAVMDLWTQRGRPCGVQSAEGDCVSRPIMTASLPPPYLKFGFQDLPVSSPRRPQSQAALLGGLTHPSRTPKSTSPRRCLGPPAY